MLYIDFDGVILDTEDLLFEEWRKNPDRHSLPKIEKIKYIQAANWRHIIYDSDIINDSVYWLKQMNPAESAILTKVHSLENEAATKIKWIREQGILQPVILVPFVSRKSDIVTVRNSILVDDCLRNLDEWIAEDGMGIFFDKDDDNYDSWHQQNTKNYQKVLTLSPFASGNKKQ